MMRKISIKKLNSTRSSSMSIYDAFIALILGDYFSFQVLGENLNWSIADTITGKLVMEMEMDDRGIIANLYDPITPLIYWPLSSL